MARGDPFSKMYTNYRQFAADKVRRRAGQVALPLYGGPSFGLRVGVSSPQHVPARIPHRAAALPACDRASSRLLPPAARNVQGWLPSVDAALRLIFDGEVLDEGQTPAELDMEDEDQIEVTWKKA
jgi:hypothetical protein